MSDFDERPAARLRWRSGGNLAEIFPYNFSFARLPEKNLKKEREISARFRPPSIRVVRRRYVPAHGQKFPPSNSSNFRPLARKY